MGEFKEKYHFEVSKNEAILEQCIDAVITIGKNGIIEFFNKAAEDLFGYNRTEVLGKNVSILAPFPHNEMHDTYIERYLKTKKANVVGIGREVDALHKDGSKLPIFLTLSVVAFDENIIFTAFIKDYRKVKAQEEKLKILSLVADKTDNVIVVTDTNLNMYWANKAFVKVYGMEFEEFAEKYGRNIKDSSSNKNIERIYTKMMKTGEMQTYISYFNKRNGDKVWFHTTMTPIQENGKIDRVICIDADITKLKTFEENLISEQQKSEQLLLNVLPAEIAKELMETGEAIPKYYEKASVLFADFKDFTQTCELFRPHEIVNQLNKHFKVFDSIIDKYKLEKIKTIGDAYMCASGVPKADMQHGLRIVLGAIEMKEYSVRYASKNKGLSDSVWKIRIGINSGDIIAGVVGQKKFAYDVWGDTVNVAARMEQNSEPFCINISSNTYNLVKDYLECEPRGKLDAKNKGRIEMYFVKGIKKEYMSDKNDAFPGEFLTKLLDIKPIKIQE